MNFIENDNLVSNISGISNVNKKLIETQAIYNPITQIWEQVIYAWPNTRYQQKLGKDPSMAYTNSQDIKDPIFVDAQGIADYSVQEANDIVQDIILVYSTDTFQSIAENLFTQTGYQFVKRI